MSLACLNPFKYFFLQTSKCLRNMAYKPCVIWCLATSLLSSPTILFAYFFQPCPPRLLFLERDGHALY